jgi:hypothetical protein
LAEAKEAAADAGASGGKGGGGGGGGKIPPGGGKRVTKAEAVAPPKGEGVDILDAVEENADKGKK